MTWPDGTSFGTLCAIDPHPQPQTIVADLPYVELIASLLCTQLQKDLEIAALSRVAEQTRTEAETDALTGLYNGRVWDRLMSVEDDRCRRFGHPAGVVVIDWMGRNQ